MINGIIRLNIIRDGKSVFNSICNNTINEHLYQDIQQHLLNGTSFSSSIQSIVGHFTQNPNLSFSKMKSDEITMGFKFNRGLKSDVVGNEITINQGILGPLDQTDLSWTFKSFCLGRDFSSVSSDSISSNPPYSSYTLTNMYNFGQLNRVYAYWIAPNPITIIDGDQFKISWTLKIANNG